MTSKPPVINPGVIAPTASPEENLMPEGPHSPQLLASIARHEHEIAAELNTVIAKINELLAEHDKPS